MDLIIYIASFILLTAMAGTYGNMYPKEKKSAKVAIFMCIAIAAATSISSIKLATTTTETFYNVNSFQGISFDKPTDIMITTTIYPKWSVLSNDTFFKQTYKGN